MNWRFWKWTLEGMVGMACILVFCIIATWVTVATFQESRPTLEAAEVAPVSDACSRVLGSWAGAMGVSVKGWECEIVDGAVCSCRVKMTMGGNPWGLYDLSCTSGADGAAHCRAERLDR